MQFQSKKRDITDGVHSNATLRNILQEYRVCMLRNVLIKRLSGKSSIPHGADDVNESGDMCAQKSCASRRRAHASDSRVASK